MTAPEWKKRNVGRHPMYRRMKVSCCVSVMIASSAGNARCLTLILSPDGHGQTRTRNRREICLTRRRCRCNVNADTELGFAALIPYMREGRGYRPRGKHDCRPSSHLTCRTDFNPFHKEGRIKIRPTFPKGLRHVEHCRTSLALLRRHHPGAVSSRSVRSPSAPAIFSPCRPYRAEALNQGRALDAQGGHQHLFGRRARPTRICGISRRKPPAKSAANSSPIADQREPASRSAKVFSRMARHMDKCVVIRSSHRQRRSTRRVIQCMTGWPHDSLRFRWAAGQAIGSVLAEGARPGASVGARSSSASACRANPASSPWGTPAQTGFRRPGILRQFLP